MTSHIKRFLETAKFEAKFGPDYMKKVAGLTGQERDDSAAFSFADEIRKFYRYTCTSVVLNPLQNKTHFHMIYGTRHKKGVEKFKEAEKSCFGFMEAARLNAHKRVNGAQDDSQGVLFEDMALPEEDEYLRALRGYYQREALAALDNHRGSSKSITDELAWEIAAGYPLVWKSDLREWMKRRVEREPTNAKAAARNS